MTKLIFNPPVIAHRGASAYAPENTMSAFIKAIQLGVKWVEFDVMQASSGELIIFHDETLERTTNGKGEVIQTHYHELASLDAGKWFDAKYSGERIPPFTDVLTFLAEQGVNANVEIKALPGYEKNQISKMVKLVKPFLQSEGNILLFSSFSWDALKIIRELLPDCLIGLLLHEWQDGWQKKIEEFDPVSVHVNEEIISEQSARSIKDMGKALLCYTVNNPDRARILFKWGVDAVFSDFPDRIMNITKL